MDKQVFLVRYPTPKKAVQFYFDWFADAWLSEGGCVKKSNHVIPIKWASLLTRLGLIRSVEELKSSSKACLMVCNSYPSARAFPWNYRYEVIPVLWDSWPRYWRFTRSFIKHNQVKIFFTTSRQMCDLAKEWFPHLHAYWIPEGINTHIYNKGNELKCRSIDVLELGRKMSEFHEKLTRDKPENMKSHLFEKEPGQIIFPSFQELKNGLADAKITVCFPRTMSHPLYAGGIETLTQRYWECMLSRTLIIGKAPQELVDWVGYNPVVEINLEKVGTEVTNILQNIDSYQDFVDKNYQTALKYGGWDNRVRMIKDKLEAHGYGFSMATKP